MSAALKPEGESQAHSEVELTDGFHLVIDALKLNGIKTIYGVPGIPITDLGRMAQAEGSAKAPPTPKPTTPSAPSSKHRASPTSP